MKQALVFRRKAINARCQNSLHRRWDASSLHWLYQTVVATLADKRLGLDEHSNALLEKKWVSLRLRDELLLERFDRAVGAEQRIEKLDTAFRSKWIDAQLSVGALSAPRVFVLGSIVDQKKQPGCGDALDEAIEKALGLRVDPMKVLQRQTERLHLAFTD